MKKHTLILASLLLLFSCGKNSDTSQICGTYQGILPAASGPGIDTSITFNPDNNSYQEKLIYIDEPDGNFSEYGQFSINGKIIKLTPSKSDETAYYQIEKSQIRRLDNEQKLIEGTLADYYILKQTQPCAGKSKP